MNDIYFSILIPVYNVEKYIRQCLDTVISQTYNNFEVIVMNDGSTDSSVSICEEYAKRDIRIKVYNQTNQGLLLTRRNSIQKAKGDYVLFLDSDDYWEENLLEEVYKSIKKYQCDMLLFRYNRVNEYGRLMKRDIGVFENETLFTKENKELLFKQFIKGSRVNNIWAKAVRREIIDVDTDYTNFKDKKSEDLLQSMPLFYKAESILYLDKPLYNYRLSISGRGRNFKAQYLDDIWAVRKVVYDYMIRMGYDSNENLKLFYSYYILCIVRFAKAFVKTGPTQKEISNTLNGTKKKELFVNALDHLNFSGFSFDEKICYYLFVNNRYRIFTRYIRINNSIKQSLKKVIRR
ncbi:glycosyltransferase family 2 protein [Priestia endophytica]|uniref:glycosyltransferase family 2 protein n=1 Tax=Priestia endophytica TaxID=135735 RepID=UPI002E1C9ECD|nr:glycosyltransferase family 2 protein [Priestia endophytica]